MEGRKRWLSWVEEVEVDETENSGESLLSPLSLSFLRLFLLYIIDALQVV